MTKRLLVGLLAICLGATTLPGCTSGGNKDEAEVAEANDQQFAEEGEGDFADGDGDESGDQASGDEASGEPAPGDQAGDDAPVEDTGDDLNIDEAPKDEMAIAEEPPPADDDLSLDEPKEESTDVAANEETPAPQPLAEEPPPPTDEPVFDEPAKEEKTEIAANDPPEPAQESTPVDTYSAPRAPVVYAPLLKIKEAAFTSPDGSATLNRVYLARPKDNWKSVSTKVYGAPDRVKDLKKWNPGVSISTGKKIYYSSPTNPSDGRMLTYFEEQNVPPQTYVSQPGDNIRKVSKNLLGFNDAWREVWATNLNVESKGDLPAGTELKYWNESAAPTQTIAANDGLPPTNPMDQPLPDAAPVPPSDSMMPPPDMNAPPPNQAGLPPTDGVDPLAPPPPMPEDPTATG